MIKTRKKKLFSVPSLRSHALLVTKKEENYKGHHKILGAMAAWRTGICGWPDKFNDDKMMMSKTLKERACLALLSIQSSE